MVLIVTVCTLVYVAATGLNVGVATTGKLIAYSAEATALSVEPDLKAIAFSVSVTPTDTAALYRVPTVEVGVLPSVVYRIDDPAVAELSATVCTLVYVPATGLNVGVATTGKLIVYSAEATALSLEPDLKAIAFSVSVTPTDTAALYRVPTVEVGVLPSVVYRIDDPAVAELIVTVCALVYVPATGLNVGVATTGKLIV